MHKVHPWREVNMCQSWFGTILTLQFHPFIWGSPFFYTFCSSCSIFFLSLNVIVPLNVVSPNIIVPSNVVSPNVVVPSNVVSSNVDVNPSNVDPSNVTSSS